MTSEDDDPPNGPFALVLLVLDGQDAQFQELLLKDTSMWESKATVLMADESIVWHATLF